MEESAVLFFIAQHSIGLRSTCKWLYNWSDQRFQAFELMRRDCVSNLNLSNLAALIVNREKSFERKRPNLTAAVDSAWKRKIVNKAAVSRLPRRDQELLLRFLMKSSCLDPLVLGSLHEFFAVSQLCELYCQRRSQSFWLAYILGFALGQVRGQVRNVEKIKSTWIQDNVLSTVAIEIYMEHCGHPSSEWRDTLPWMCLLSTDIDYAVDRWINIPHGLLPTRSVLLRNYQFSDKFYARHLDECLEAVGLEAMLVKLGDRLQPLLTSQLHDY